MRCACCEQFERFVWLKHSKSKTGMLFMIETLMLSLPAVLSVGLFMVS